MDPATAAAIGNAFLGGFCAIPVLLAWTMLIAGYRMQSSGRERGKRGRPSWFRLIMGSLFLIFFLLVLGGMLMEGVGVSSVVMIFMAVGGLIYQLSQLNQTETVQVTQAPPAPNPERFAQALVGLKRRDQGFSRVVFLDYVQALYHGLHGWLGTPAHRQLSAYVSDEVMQELVREAGVGARSSAIVLGVMNIEKINLGSQPGAMDVIQVELEGNYTRERDGAEAVRLVVRERWRLERVRDATSPAPDRMRVLSCASCGAALSVSELGACTYCNATLSDGKLQWRLARRKVLSTESFSTEGLGETVPEAGTELETVRDPRLAKYGAALAEANGQAGLDDFAAQFEKEVVAPIFNQMYAAWSQKSWNAVRHLLTDFLWEAQLHWVRAYAEKGLTNKLDDLALASVEIARVERDRYYDAVTVRLHASCKDYTVDKAGKLIGGDRKHPREFSEYWTFVRSANAKKERGPLERCPNCGAPVDQMGSTGICGYCNAKVTTGDFGWVLSTITQDEVYTG